MKSGGQYHTCMVRMPYSPWKCLILQRCLHHATLHLMTSFSGSFCSKYGGGWGLSNLCFQHEEVIILALTVGYGSLFWGSTKKSPTEPQKAKKCPWFRAPKSRFQTFVGIFGDFFCGPPKRPLLRLSCDFGPGGPGDSCKWWLGSQALLWGVRDIWRLGSEDRWRRHKANAATILVKALSIEAWGLSVGKRSRQRQSHLRHLQSPATAPPAAEKTREHDKSDRIRSVSATLRPLSGCPRCITKKVCHAMKAVCNRIRCCMHTSQGISTMKCSQVRESRPYKSRNLGLLFLQSGCSRCRFSLQAWILQGFCREFSCGFLSEFSIHRKKSHKNPWQNPRSQNENSSRRMQKGSHEESQLWRAHNFAEVAVQLGDSIFSSIGASRTWVDGTPVTQHRVPRRSGFGGF